MNVLTVQFLQHPPDQWNTFWKSLDRGERVEVERDLANLALDTVGRTVYWKSRNLRRDPTQAAIRADRAVLDAMKILEVKQPRRNRPVSRLAEWAKPGRLEEVEGDADQLRALIGDLTERANRHRQILNARLARCIRVRARLRNARLALRKLTVYGKPKPDGKGKERP